MHKIPRVAFAAFLFVAFSIGAYAAPSNPVVELLSTVKTTKGFSDKAVADELLKAILACGANAPSAMNKQPWFFSVLTGKAARDSLRKASEAEMAKRMPQGGAPAGAPGAGSIPGAGGPPPGARDPLDGAPVVIVVSGAKDWAWSVFDCGLACGAMANAAASLGLGSHIVAGPVDAIKGERGSTLRKLCAIPEDMEPVMILLLGYPANPADAASKASTRRPTSYAFVR